jgi:hypothetical protein
MSIIAGVTAAKASLELTTKLMDLLNRPSVDVAEVRGQVHEMLIHLVNAQTALGEAQIEISELRQKLQDVSGQKDLESSLVYVENVYWKRLAENSLDGPFCPECRHSPSQRLSRMRFIREDEYRDFQGNQPRRLRKYDCLLHGGETKTVDYLIPAELFSHVKVHWSPPPAPPSN